MSEKEASEKQIVDALNNIILGERIRIKHSLKLLAKLIFNLRFDLDELKIELLKVISGEEDSCFDRDNGECNDGEYYS